MFRKRCMKLKKKHDIDDLLSVVPIKELAEIVQDSENHNLRNLQIGVKDLRLNLVSGNDPYLSQLQEEDKPDLLFDADFDFNVMRRTMTRTVVADIAVAVKTVDKDKKVLVINVKSCVRAVCPGYLINKNVDTILADYGLHYLHGVLKHINLSEYGVKHPVSIPEHLSDLRKEDSIIYDGFKVKYQL